MVRCVMVATVFAAMLSATPASAYVISSNGGTFTQGWDGAGLGSVTIDWYLGWSDLPDDGLPTGFGLAAVEAEIMAAMATWSSVAAITWNYVGNSINNPDSAGLDDQFGSAASPRINIFWGAEDHGDGFDFDGRWDPQDNTGSVFAHAWAPPDIQNNVFDGNVHLDKDELWVTSGAPSFGIGTTLDPIAIDIQSVVLHELGHSLGLSHSNASGAVMNPFYFGPQRTLGQDDIDGIQALYAPAQTGGGGGGGNQDPVGVPEPSSLALFGLALSLGAVKGRFSRTDR